MICHVSKHIPVHTVSTMNVVHLSFSLTSCRENLCFIPTALDYFQWDCGNLLKTPGFHFESGTVQAPLVSVVSTGQCPVDDPFTDSGLQHSLSVPLCYRIWRIVSSGRKAVAYDGLGDDLRGCWVEVYRSAARLCIHVCVQQTWSYIVG
jgi:hypothetical protein